MVNRKIYDDLRLCSQLNCLIDLVLLKAFPSNWKSMPLANQLGHPLSSKKTSTIKPGHILLECIAATIRYRKAQKRMECLWTISYSLIRQRKFSKNVCEQTAETHGFHRAPLFDAIDLGPFAETVRSARHNTAEITIKRVIHY